MRRGALHDPANLDLAACMALARRSRLNLAALLGMVVALAIPWQAAAQDVVRIEERQFRAGAGRITFAEVPEGTPNPVYPPERYGGDAGSPTVRFAGLFQGRRIATAQECPPGAVRTGCLGGAARAPLALDAASPPVATIQSNDRSINNAIALGGTPTWNGPVAIWFDRDVAAVGLHAIGLDALGGTAITVYDRQGRSLGRTVNRAMPVDFIGLATADLSARIAGLEFHLVGPEPAGFGVKNIRFGTPQQVDLPGVVPPPPATRRAPVLP